MLLGLLMAEPPEQLLCRLSLVNVAEVGAAEVGAVDL
uniref:Uncharacterized protein n=1 Tax=Arundo donax TaxID=35708 RepID=A0A0A9CWC5_ARUDO